MSDAPTVSVVVATRNRADLVGRLLDHLHALDGGPPAEVIIVDDGSTDDTARRVTEFAQHHPSVQLLRIDRSRGPAHARNVGWRRATHRYIAFTDDDCRPTPSWLEALAAGHARGADVVQGATLADPHEYDSRTALSHWITVEEPSFRFETCNISYRRDLLERLGGFDEAFGTSRGGAPYGEDADLGWRATDAGATFVFARDALVVHDVVSDGFRRFLARRLRRSSMPYFVRKHPGYRGLLPRPWLLTAAHPPAVGALLGLIVAVALFLGLGRPLVALPVAALGAIPYIRHRLFRDRVSGRRRMWPLAIAATWIADLVEIGALVGGSVRARTLLL
jgi:glycosyltransferase involved in cell wall biosynthesis